MEEPIARSFDAKGAFGLFITGVLIALGLIFIGLTVAHIWIGFGQGFPRNQHHIPEQELFLYFHFAASLIVFILLPLQLFKSLRRRMGRAHRRIGYAILIFMIPSAIGGISLATTVRLNAVGKLGFGLGGFFLAVKRLCRHLLCTQTKVAITSSLGRDFRGNVLGGHSHSA